ncbi:hypothetical protein ACSNOK_32655, partial [Streptomyces sp. URMC 126]|uniref:hypothetical protein n=1 Tax=Streptomyces sp. URMC 126 TaxID=3423401 RepID=UPI003F1B0AF6
VARRGCNDVHVMSAAQQAGQAPRALRAAMFAAVCVLLAALGHALMSGTDVPWWAIIAALSGTGGCAWFLAGRERGPLLITLATVGAQTALHFFFTLAQQVSETAGGHAGSAAGHGSGALPSPGFFSRLTCGAVPSAASGSSAGGADGAAMGGMLMNGSGPSGPSPSGGMPLHGTHMDMMGIHGLHGPVGMWSAHLLVALICGLWLSGGEQAAFRLGRAVGARLVAPLLLLFGDPVPGPRPPRVRPGLGRAAQRLRRLLYAYALITRGPPATLAVGL